MRKGNTKSLQPHPLPNKIEMLIPQLWLYYQAVDQCMGMQRYILNNPPNVPPIMHEGKLKECHIDPTEW